jgi:hypothetical protein
MPACGTDSDNKIRREIKKIESENSVLLGIPGQVD